MKNVPQLKLIEGGKGEEFPLAFAVLIVAGVIIYVVFKNVEVKDGSTTGL